MKRVSVLEILILVIILFSGCQKTTKNFIGKYQVITCQYNLVPTSGSMIGYSNYFSRSYQRTDAYYSYELCPVSINIFEDAADGKIRGNVDAKLFINNKYNGSMKEYSAHFNVNSFELERDTLTLNVSGELTKSFNISIYKEKGQTIFGLPIKFTKNCLETLKSPFVLRFDKKYIYYKNITDEKQIIQLKKDFYRLLINIKQNEIKKEKSIIEIETLENTVSQLELRLK
jgi:hypothetical protein